jgi:hypothetical protein
MRPTPWLKAEPFRIQPAGYESPYGADYGAFVFSHQGENLRCIVSSGKSGLKEMGKKWAWDHISVSLINRCPTWEEMSFIKDIFFTGDETVMQLHVPTNEHINFHPHTLHLWRPLILKIPRPPSDAVGVPGGMQANIEHRNKLLKRR